MLWQFRPSSYGSINGLGSATACYHGNIMANSPTSCKRRPKSPAYLEGSNASFPDEISIAQCGNSKPSTSLPPSSSFPRLLGTTRPLLHRKHQETMESMEWKSDSNGSQKAHLESSISMLKAPWNMFSISDVSIEWVNIYNSLQRCVIISCTWRGYLAYKYAAKRDCKIGLKY